MKILWLSDSPNLSTGYGIVTNNIVKRLINLGYDVKVIGWNNIKEEKFGNYTIYPRKEDFYCRDILQSYIKKFKPNVLITLCDLSFIFYFKNLNFNKVKWIPYYPIDGIPVPLIYRELLKKAYRRIAMSEFGAEAVKRDVNLDSEIIYHGVDIDVFKPLDKEKIKKEFGLEDKFIVGFIGRNQLRKMIPELIKAFKIFSKDKDDVILYLHTEPISKTGWNLLDFVKLHNIQDKVIFSNKNSLASGFNSKEMARLYNLFDVYASATAGEGFGLCSLESMSCGIPNVLTDYTTSKELIWGRGELVKVKTFITDYLNSGKAIVDTEDFAKKLNLLYNNQELRKEYSRRSIEFVRKYSWDNMIRLWDIFLKSI